MMLFIRTDSNPEISSGHIMRCLSIAQACIESGNSVCFLVSDNNAVSLLQRKKMPYKVLNSYWRYILPEVQLVGEILRDESKPVLLIDTYSVTFEYVEELRPFCHIVYLGSKKEYLGKISLLINYSTDIDRAFYSNNYDSDTKLLLGPSYAPLRKEFQNTKHRYNDCIKRILLTTGNTNRNHIAERILDSLLLVLNDIKIDVIVGSMYEAVTLFHEKYSTEENIIIHENVIDMSVIINNSDLAISANGTTIYELSAIGVPTISFSMVEEQVNSAEAMARLGVIEYCGCSYDNTLICVEKIIEKVGLFMSDYGKAISMGRHAHGLIDGRGCQRIIEAILKL